MMELAVSCEGSGDSRFFVGGLMLNHKNDESLDSFEGLLLVGDLNHSRGYRAAVEFWLAR